MQLNDSYKQHTREIILKHNRQISNGGVEPVYINTAKTYIIQVHIVFLFNILFTLEKIF